MNNILNIILIAILLAMGIFGVVNFANTKNTTNTTTSTQKPATPQLNDNSSSTLQESDLNSIQLEDPSVDFDLVDSDIENL